MNRKEYNPEKNPFQSKFKEHFFYDGLPVQSQHGDLNENYLDIIKNTIFNSLNEHPKTYALRVDLTLPHSVGIDSLGDWSERDIPSLFEIDDYGLPSKFVAAFKSRVKAYLKRRKKKNLRVYQCTPRVIWCREQNTSHNQHYHLLILVNNHTFKSVNNWSELGEILINAWASALGCDNTDAIGLVDFTKDGSHYLELNNVEFEQQLGNLFYHASYLAKIRTKNYGCGHRAFGYSLS